MTLEERIIALDTRLEAAESTISKLSGLVFNGALSTLPAPFRVIDQEGKLIFEVSITEKGADRRIRVFNRNGEATAALGSDIDGGNLVIRDNVGKIVSYLSVGPYGARFSMDASKTLAGVDFYTDDNGGGLVISDVKGQISAELHTDADGGVLVLRDDQETPIIVLPPEDEHSGD